MNLRIPNDLKARMDAVDGVNWSAVARAAFEQKIVQINSRKDKPTMEDVAARLRSTRVQTVEKKGKALGRAWAINDATEDELEALEAHTAKLKTQHTNWDKSSACAAQTALPLSLVQVYKAAAPVGPVPFSLLPAADAWWDAIGGQKDPSDVTLQGFINGALEVYNEVKSIL